MSDLDLFDDYSEQWLPSKPSCYDCAHIERPIPGWKEPSRCRLLGRIVDRAMGRCGQYKPCAGREP